MTETNRSNSPVIGEVYLMKFDGSGSEQSGWRPGVIFQNNTGNAYSPNIIALPLTTALKKSAQPTHVIIRAEDSGLHKDSMVLCENPERMSKSKVGRFITKLSDKYMREIAYASILATSAVSFLSETELVSVWKKAAELNCVA